jgi:hypothetical protein
MCVLIVDAVVVYDYYAVELRRIQFTIGIFGSELVLIWMRILRVVWMR